MKSITAAVLAMTLVYAGTAAAGERQPWLWTAEERAAKRFAADVPLHIEGRSRPELFFPVELFSTFVQMCFSNPRSGRSHVRQNSDDLFRTDADWNVMKPIAERYAGAIREEERLLRQSTGDQEHDARLKPAIAAAQTLKRAEEPVALRKAREKFGRVRFDRFLYEVIAPTRFITYVSAPSEAEQRYLLAREKAAE